MRTKWVDKTPQGDIEAVVSLTFPEISFLHHAVNMYIDRKFGDVDDPKEIKLKHEIKEDLREAMRALRGESQLVK